MADATLPATTRTWRRRPHPTGPVAAVLLALAERAPLPGDAFLTALVLGLEVACRLSTALLVPPARGQVGWYITGVTGGIDAALAAAKGLGLPRQQTIWALGLAAAQASGFRQTHATSATSFVPAHAARCGLQAAMLAAHGFTCSDRILEGPHGFTTVFAEDAHLAAASVWADQAADGDRDSPRHLPPLSRMSREEGLQLFITYHPRGSFLYVTVAMGGCGSFHDGWRRGRLQKVTAYRRSTFPVLDCKNRSVCGFRSAA